MYCETYEKEMVVFDKEQAAIHDTLKKYAAETGNNVSFFSSFFSTSDS